MGPIKPWHLIVLVIAFILLFGWKNLPNVARSLGESMRVFKKEVDDMKTDNAQAKAERPALDDDHPRPEAPGQGGPQDPHH